MSAAKEAEIVGGELVRYSSGFGQRERIGFVESVRRNKASIKDRSTGQVELIRLSRVTVLSGGDLDAQLPAILPTLRIARTDGQPVAAPRRSVKPEKRSGYLAWLHLDQPCVNLRHAPHDGPAHIHAHHQGPRGLSQKADDLLTVPLCEACHQAFHDQGTLPGWPSKAAAIDFIYEEQLRLVGLYVRYLQGR